MDNRRRRARGEVLRLALTALGLSFAGPAEAQDVDRWSAEIAEASARFAVPKDWIRRVMKAESGGHLSFDGVPVTSRAGAMGLMQLMPGTWREMRALLGLGADPFEARDNILAGTAYLRRMYELFGYPGLFAAYNAGPARYARHLQTGARLPTETAAYLAQVAGEGHPEGSAIALQGTARAGAGAAMARVETPSLFALRRGVQAGIGEKDQPAMDRLFAVKTAAESAQ